MSIWVDSSKGSVDDVMLSDDSGLRLMSDPKKFPDEFDLGQEITEYYNERALKAIK
ncbi:MAG: hypothetical protein ACOCXG_03040 [Nanoarchaeota archaeon]